MISLLLILACLAAVLLAGYMTLRLTAPSRPRIQGKVAAILAIKGDMTEKEVEGILGPKTLAISPKDLPAGIGSGSQWNGEDMYVLILFDKNGHVKSISQAIINESFLAKLRRWLGM